MTEQDASVLVSDIQQINERTKLTDEKVDSLVVLLRGDLDDPGTGLVGEVATLKAEVKSLKTFRKYSVAGLVFVVGLLVANTLANTRLIGVVSQASAVAAQPSSLSNVFRIEPEIAWHSISGDVYHNNNRCTQGGNIQRENLRQGAGGNGLCKRCSQLNR